MHPGSYIKQLHCYPAVAFLFFLACCPATAFSQKRLSGTVLDRLTLEPVPSASLVFQDANAGMLTDSAGKFQADFIQWPSLRLSVSSVGYTDTLITLDPSSDTIVFNIYLSYRSLDSVYIVRKNRNDRGLQLWRKVVGHKKNNDLSQLDHYAFEQYDKTEIDLRNIRLERINIFNPLWLLKKEIYSIRGELKKEMYEVHGQQYIPAYLSESVSDHYFSRDPYRHLELIKAINHHGIDNKTFHQALEELNTNVDVYANNIRILSRDFAGPFHSLGKNFYQYTVTDTQWIGKNRFFRLLFTPKYQGSNTLEGDCWIADSSFAVQQARFKLSSTTNLNFVSDYSFYKEFKEQDSQWFPSKEQVTTEFAAISKTLPGFISTRTSTFIKANINDTLASSRLKEMKLPEQKEIAKGATKFNAQDWALLRHETPGPREAAILKLTDTLEGSKAFDQLKTKLKFFATGYYTAGMVDIGPWFYWLSSNSYEGLRGRFDLRTNTSFSKKLWLHGYIAYGMDDQQAKGKMEALYLLKGSPRAHFRISYSNDLDFDQNYYSDFPGNNLFAGAIKKAGVPQKFIRKTETRLEFFRETGFGLSANLKVSEKRYDPLQHLPLKSAFTIEGGKNPFSSFEIGLALRYAYLEKFMETDFFRYSKGSRFPILTTSITRGITGILGGNQRYTKLSAHIAQKLEMAGWGKMDLNLFAARTYGTLPYLFLDPHPGNDLHYFNRNAFNLMNRYEFISDRFYSFNVEHEFGRGIFRLIPGLNWRQFWNAKLLNGTLSKENTALNIASGHGFKTLGNKYYVELGTGIDNIFNLLRLDLVWNVSPAALVSENKRFGIFGSARISF